MPYMRKKTVKEALEALKENTHRIYGIFDFKEKKLVDVELDLSLLEIQYDFGIEDKERFKIVTMEVTLL